MNPAVIADDLLTASVDALVNAGITPPARQYVAHSRPAGDLCEELVVWVDPVMDLGSLGERSLIIRHEATFHVAITLCHPTLTPSAPIPPAQDLSDAATGLIAAGWVIWLGIVKARNTVFGDCELVNMVDLVPEGPQAGFATWVSTVRATITPTPGAGS